MSDESTLGHAGLFFAFNSSLSTHRSALAKTLALEPQKV